MRVNMSVDAEDFIASKAGEVERKDPAAIDRRPP
jgi:hypothetical protein